MPSSMARRCRDGAANPTTSACKYILKPLKKCVSFDSVTGTTSPALAGSGGSDVVEIFLILQIRKERNWQRNVVSCRVVDIQADDMMTPRAALTPDIGLILNTIVAGALGVHIAVLWRCTHSELPLF
jgi:hypothetical protein